MSICEIFFCRNNPLSCIARTSNAKNYTGIFLYGTKALKRLGSMTRMGKEKVPDISHWV